MSTQTHNVTDRRKNVAHSAVHLMHGAYGHNQLTNETAVYDRSRHFSLFANSASCELKFH